MKAKAIVITVLAATVIAVGFYFSVARHTLMSESKRETPRLFPVCDRCGSKDGRWGYIDANGKMAINFQFEEVADFSEGLAAVKTGNRWGFIDEDGKFAINPQFDKVGSFTDGLVAVNVGHQWGYSDKTGKYAINPQFDAAGVFADGLAIVMAGGKWGYIDKDGKYIINPQFDDAWWFADGLAAVKIGDKWGYINEKGKYLINPQFDETSDAFSEDRAAFKIGDKWGYIDEDGKYVINPQFDTAKKFSEGLAVVKSGDKWGYIDRKGKFAITPQFANAEDFSEGFAAVKIGDKWGYIDKTGKIVINPQFNGRSVGSFRRGVASIMPNLYVNAKAEWIWPNAQNFQSDTSQLYPLLNSDRPADATIDGGWTQCVNNLAARPLCFQLNGLTNRDFRSAMQSMGNSQGNSETDWGKRALGAISYGKAIFHDRKSAQLASKLQFDGVFFDTGDGFLFAMKPTPDGWAPFPGIPPKPFMLETVPDLPSLPTAGNGDSGTPLTPVSEQGTNQ